MKQMRIGFIGFGHMAEILYEAFDRAKILPRGHYLFTRRDPAKKKAAEEKYKITACGLDHLIQESDVLILAVRPQQMEDAMEQMLAVGDLEGKTLISILAGVKVHSFQKKVPGLPVIRVMPNLASSVGEGMTTLTYSKECSPEIREFARMLFSAVGKIVEIEEQQIDIATGLSGSGPGFVFRLIDAFAKEGERGGLSREQALSMAAQTFYGAAKLLLQGHDLETLIVQIAVPNGTTQAGLDKMRELEVGPRVQEVVRAAAKRSIELSKHSSS